MTLQSVLVAAGQWEALVAAGTDPLDAIVALSRSDCRVHLKRGEVVTPAIAEREIVFLRDTFPTWK